MSAVVTLKKGEGRTIKAGGAWIFDNEIDTVMGSFENGEIVVVHDFDGYPMGKGFINTNSKIRIRMLTRHVDQEIDRTFLQMRVKNAWEYRKTTVDTSSCRVIFGEADFLPGLVVDKYEDVLVVECLALGMEQFKETIVSLLKEELAKDGIKVRGVYERSDANERTKEGLPKVKGFIGEEFDTNVEIKENGVRYLVDVVNGQKTGFFLDQKYNRLAMQQTPDIMAPCAGISRNPIIHWPGSETVAADSHCNAATLPASSIRSASASSPSATGSTIFVVPWST